MALGFALSVSTAEGSSIAIFSASTPEDAVRRLAFGASEGQPVTITTIVAGGGLADVLVPGDVVYSTEVFPGFVKPGDVVRLQDPRGNAYFRRVVGKKDTAIIVDSMSKGPPKPEIVIPGFDPMERIVAVRKGKECGENPRRATTVALAE